MVHDIKKARSTKLNENNKKKTSLAPFSLKPRPVSHVRAEKGTYQRHEKQVRGRHRGQIAGILGSKSLQIDEGQNEGGRGRAHVLRDVEGTVQIQLAQAGSLEPESKNQSRESILI